MTNITVIDRSQLNTEEAYSRYMVEKRIINVKSTFSDQKDILSLLLQIAREDIFKQT